MSCNEISPPNASPSITERIRMYATAVSSMTEFRPRNVPFRKRRLMVFVLLFKSPLNIEVAKSRNMRAPTNKAFCQGAV